MATQETEKKEQQSQPGSTPDPILEVEEVFGNPDYASIGQNGEFALFNNLKWTIWEFIEYDASKRDWANKNYEKLVRKVAWFDNMITFHQAWNRVPHADIRKLLFDGESFKVFKDHEGHNYQVTCLMLFKHGIIPAYEDKRNKAELRLDFGLIRDLGILQSIWETVVFDFMTGNCPGLDTQEGINGVRVVQKSKNFNVNGFRIEIWVSTSNEYSEIVKKIKKYIDSNIKQDILSEDPSIKDVQQKFNVF